jgi:hypothetical protein
MSEPQIRSLVSDTSKVLTALNGATPELRAAIYGRVMGLRMDYDPEGAFVDVSVHGVLPGVSVDPTLSGKELVAAHVSACTSERVGGGLKPYAHRRSWRARWRREVMDNLNIVSVTNDPRLDTAIEGAKPVWLPILRESYRIPEVVGEETAIAAILKDVEAYLTPSEIDPDNQPAAARLILAATLELLTSHELDACFLPSDLNGSTEINPVARVVSQAGLTAKAEESKRAINDAAESIVARVLHQIPDPRQEG